MSEARATMAWGALAGLLAVSGAVANCSLVNAPDDLVPEGPTGGTGLVGVGGSSGGGGSAPGCSDGEKSGTETDVDCGGGACAACANGSTCMVPRDCQSAFCDTSQQPSPLCQPCIDDVNCTVGAGSYCEQQTCVPKKEPGASCAAANECLSDFCADGVCCNTVCDGSCDACNLADTSGTCTPVSQGEPGEPSCAPYLCNGADATCPASCVDPADCTTEAFCQGGACLGQKSPGDDCDNGPECLSGFCVDGVCCTAAACGTASDCNICQPGSGTCGNAPASHSCSDGLYCNGEDTCDDAGNCVAPNVDPCAASSSDGDANCSEGCDENADSCTAAEPDGTACDDTIYCNGADSCAGGACASHSGDPCAGSMGDGDANCAEACNENADNCTTSEPNGTACNDGAYCNGTDTCSAGNCSGHSGNPCPGHNVGPNCNDSCNENVDSCTANDVDGTACTSCSTGTCTPCAAGVCANLVPAGCALTAIPGILICISNNKVNTYSTAAHCMACTEKGLTNACVSDPTCRQGYTNAIIEQLYLQRTGLTCTAQTNQSGTCGWGEIMTPNYLPAGNCPTPQDCTVDLNWENCTYGTGTWDAYTFGVCNGP